MPKKLQADKRLSEHNFMDTLMYILAGSAMAIMSLSFLLWLRY